MLFLILFLALPSVADEIKFAQVADAHYDAQNTYAKTVLQNTIRDINKQRGINFVVFTGDNINRPDPKSLEEFVKLANKLDIPYYIVIGDHDVSRASGMDKTRYTDIIRRHNLSYKYRRHSYTFTKGRFVFITADGAKEIIPGPIGYYKEDTLDWLQKQLAKYKRRHVVILQHFPLAKNQSKSNATHKAEEYLAILKKNTNVIAVVAGHTHRNDETMRDGVYHITSPSLISEPNSYKIIKIVTTKGFSPMIYTELREVNK